MSANGSNVTEIQAPVAPAATTAERISGPIVTVGETEMAGRRLSGETESVVILNDSFKTVATVPDATVGSSPGNHLAALASWDGKYLLVNHGHESSSGASQNEVCVVATLHCRSAPSSASTFMPNDELLIFGEGSVPRPSPDRGAFFNPATGAITPAPAVWSQLEALHAVLPTALLDSVLKVIEPS